MKIAAMPHGVRFGKCGSDQWRGFSGFYPARRALLSRDSACVGGARTLLIVSHQGITQPVDCPSARVPATSLWHFRVERGMLERNRYAKGFATLKVLNSRAVWRPE